MEWRETKSEVRVGDAHSSRAESRRVYSGVDESIQ